MSVYSARRLAREILGPDATDTDVVNLARCMYVGRGIYRVSPGQRQSRVVLYSPLRIAAQEAPDHKPICTVSIGTAATGKHVYTTAGLATEFGARYCRGLGDTRPLGYANTWLPAAVRSRAVLPLGGLVAASYQGDTGSGDDRYQWYDLASEVDYPVGCVIYRITSAHALVGWTRVGPDTWVQFDSNSLSSGHHARRHIRASGVTEWEPDEELATMSPALVLAAA
jgi:hypothetical protein